MQQNQNPGLTPCNCHPDGDGVVLLDFDEDDLRYAAHDENTDEVILTYRGITHTYAANRVSYELKRRFINQLRFGR
jgi:hypothetical protein